MTTQAPERVITVTVESTNALRARITRMGSKATTTRLADALGVEREALKARLQADPTFTTHRGVWRVAEYAPVGSVVRCSYWGFVYRVVSIQPGAFGSDEITVEMLDHELTENTYRPGHRDVYMHANHVIGSVWTHGTALSPRDEILTLPSEETS